LYIDTSVLVKLFVEEPESGYYGELVNDHPLSSSRLAYVELNAALIAKTKAKLITEKERQLAWRKFEYCVEFGSIVLRPMHDMQINRAYYLINRLQPNLILRTLDAIHLAVADELQEWPLVTDDARMSQAAVELGFPIATLPKPRKALINMI
jgi:predicted nucleic acid-binding protein